MKVFLINTYNSDGSNPDENDNNIGVFINHDPITNVQLEDFLVLQEKCFTYFYNFETDDNTKTDVYHDNDFLIIQFINLKKDPSDYKFSYEFRIKLSNQTDSIFDDYKRGTIIFSYSKIKSNGNPIIGIYNNNSGKTQDDVDEIDYLKMIDSQWVDDNGFGVPGLKMSLSRDEEEKIVITDNDWNSYYSKYLMVYNIT